MSGNNTGKRSLYQQAYHILAKHKSPESRRKAFQTIISNGKSSPAFIKACERVLDNNPHFLMEKGTREYNAAKQDSYSRKQKSRTEWISKIGKDASIKGQS